MSTEGSWPSFELTIGELFPASDVVAHWVFTLNAVAEDIQISLGPLKTAQNLRNQTYFYRVVITRLYEARRLIEARAKYQEIDEFVGHGLTFLGVDLVRVYTRPAQDEPSEVEQLYAQSRHRAVHYPHIGEPELEGLLRDYRNFPARLEVLDTAGELAVESQWVTAIRVQDVLGAAPWDPMVLERMREVERTTATIAAAWVMASAVFTIVYAKRQGIDLERVVGDPAKLKSAVAGSKRQIPAD